MTPRPPETAIARLRPEDIPHAVALHRALLPHGFLVELGPKVLGAYYRQFVHSPHAAAWAAHRDGEVVGALVGTAHQQRHAVWTAREMPSMSWAVAAGLARRPSKIGRFLRTRLVPYGRSLVRRLQRRVGFGGRRGGPAVAILAHVYVSDDARGGGTGGELVDAFLDAARRAGAETAELMTLQGEGGAGAFYARRGWTRADRTRRMDGRVFEIWRISLGGGGSAEQPSDAAVPASS